MVVCSKRTVCYEKNFIVQFRHNAWRPMAARCLLRQHIQIGCCEGDIIANSNHLEGIKI